LCCQLVLSPIDCLEVKRKLLVTSQKAGTEPGSTKETLEPLDEWTLLFIQLLAERGKVVLFFEILGTKVHGKSDKDIIDRLASHRVDHSLLNYEQVG
jgi:hypothetical protein